MACANGLCQLGFPSHTTSFHEPHYQTHSSHKRFPHHLTSLLLDPHPEGTEPAKSFDHMLITPQAEVMVEHFTGKPIEGNRAPVISTLEFEGGSRSRLAKPGETMNVIVAAEDADGDKVEFVTWILQSKVPRTTAVSGPVAHDSCGRVAVSAPETPGEYLVMVYAIDNRGGGSASVLPFQVPAPD